MSAPEDRALPGPVQTISGLVLEAIRTGGHDEAIERVREIGARLREELSGVDGRRIELFLDEMLATLHQAAGRTAEATALHEGILEKAGEADLHPTPQAMEVFLAKELAVLARLDLAMGDEPAARRRLEALGGLTGELLLEERQVLGIAATACAAWREEAQTLGPGQVRLLHRLVRALSGALPAGAHPTGSAAAEILKELLEAGE